MRMRCCDVTSQLLCVIKKEQNYSNVLYFVVYNFLYAQMYFRLSVINLKLTFFLSYTAGADKTLTTAQIVENANVLGNRFRKHHAPGRYQSSDDQFYSILFLIYLNGDIKLPGVQHCFA